MMYLRNHAEKSYAVASYFNTKILIDMKHSFKHNEKLWDLE